MSEVKDEIELLVSGTRFEGSPMIACSAATGQGLQELRAQIECVLQRSADAGRDERRRSAYFRLPVDRVFLLQGHGLIVTGTALGGEVRVGDQVRCLPGGQLFRVRSVQVHNETVGMARWGQRIALNLTGHEKPSIERGDVICHEQLTMTTDRFDASIEVRTTAKAGLASHQRVRVYLGTAERMGKLILLGSDDTLGPKGSALCQLALTGPLVAMRGDRFVIRDETARRTLGGGVVIHPLARRYRRREVGLLDRLETLRNGSLADALGVLLAESDQFAAPVLPLHQMLNVPAGEVHAQLARMGTVTAFAVDGELLYSTAEKWLRVRARILQLLERYHAARPLSPGMEMEAVRDALDVQVPPRVFRVVVERMESEGSIVREGSLLRLPTHRVQLRDVERTMADRVAALVGRERFAPPDLAQIEREVGASRATLADVLRVMEREQSIVRVSPELYFASSAIEEVKGALHRHLSDRAEITPATFRDLFGTTRKYAIPLLEYLDREGVTIRMGDARRLKR
jgi:selenocysteine-specific elongation factor